MQLVRLTIRRGSEVVRSISFKKGLNLIIDAPTGQRTHSGNNIGKTSVLRLIDYCLGSDGDDIWQDPEFKKNINQDVYDFLHGDIAVAVELELVSKGGVRDILIRGFNLKRGDERAFVVNQTSFGKISDYRAAVRSLLFGAGGTKPTMRQLAPKFVRSSPFLMGRTLKYLGDYASESDYEALHLFLFGFFAVDILEERPKLGSQRKRLERDLQAVTRLRNEGEIEQLLLHLRGEIEDLSASNQVAGEVPEIAAYANRVSAIRSAATDLTASLAQLEAEANAVRLTIEEFEGEYANIDKRAIESIYREAHRYIPKLQHDWSDLVEFVQNLRGRKQRFLLLQVAETKKRAEEINIQLDLLRAEEERQIGDLIESREFNKALEMRAELQEKLKRLGSLEQSLSDIKGIKERIAAINSLLYETQEEIEKWKETLRGNVAAFNRYFSKLSKELYGEEYLLHFDETEKGAIVFRLSSVGSNVGAGKKVSQTAAFDLAYVEFLREKRIYFPTFVCHDGVESIHANQLSALLEEAAGMNGQLILATLRDKLPPMSDGFIEKNTVLELSQEDKLFRI